jgi:putative transposase
MQAINILKKGLKYLGNHLNGTVGQTETDPNALERVRHSGFSVETLRI